MTNAVTQNIDTSSTTASTLDLLVQSTTSNLSFDGSGTFSNIINNLEVKTNNMQKDIEQAPSTKTNTSSINKKALENNTNSQKTAKKDTQDKKVNVSTSENNKNIQSKDATKKTSSKKETKTQMQDNNDADETNIVENEDLNAIIKPEKITKDNNIQKENLDENSDINDSSPVNPSPVFSFEENTKYQDLQEDNQASLFDDISDKISLFQDVSNVQIKKTDDNLNLENKKFEIDTLELDDNKKVEKTFFNSNDFSSNEEEQDILNDILNDIQKDFTEIKSTVSDDSFREILTQIDLDIDSLKDNLSNLNAEDITGINEDVSIYSNDKMSLKEIKPDIKNEANIEIDKQVEIEIEPEIKLSDELTENSEIKIRDNENILKTDEKPVLKTDLEEKIDSIKEKLSELNNLIKNNIEDNKSIISDDKNIIDYSNNSENLNLANEKIVKLDDSLEKLNEILSKKLSDNKNSNTIQFEDKIPEKTEKSALENNKINQSEIIEIDFSKNNTDEIIKKLDKISQLLENSDIKESNDLDDILNLMDEVQSDDKIQDEIKDKIQDILAELKIQKDENNFIKDSAKISEAISGIKAQIEPKIENNSIENIDNTLDASLDFEKIAKNSSESAKNKFNSDDLKNQNDDFNIDFKNTKNIEFDFELDSTNQTELNIETDGKIDLKETEINLQKAIAIDEMLEEMMVQTQGNIASQSGALSVADEVAKLALSSSSESSLSPVTSVHGSITYDPSNTSSMIKNAAQLMKNAQSTQNETSMNDIFNQISNRLTNLKDAQGNISGQKLTMVLRPNDLGRLSIELTNTELGLSTNILAQNEDVRLYIEKNINSLRQQLADAGVNVNNIQIKTMGQEGSSNYEGNQNFNRENNDFAQGQNHNNSNRQNGEGRNHNADKESYDKMVASLSDFDMHFGKDFSSFLNKSINYSLNQ